MAAAAIGTGLSYAPQIISGLGLAHQMGSKYGHHVKRLANNLFSAKKRKSAMNYMKGLTKPKGMKKLVKDASQLITSGKLMKGVNEVAGDAQSVLNASKGLIGDKYHSQASALIKQGTSQAQHFHDIAHNYNEQGKQLHTQFTNQMSGK